MNSDSGSPGFTPHLPYTHHSPTRSRGREKELSGSTHPSSSWFPRRRNRTRVKTQRDLPPPPVVRIPHLRGNHSTQDGIELSESVHPRNTSNHPGWGTRVHPVSLVVPEQVIEEYKWVCDKIPKITHHDLYYPLLFKIFSD